MWGEVGNYKYWHIEVNSQACNTSRNSPVGKKSFLHNLTYQTERYWVLQIRSLWKRVNQIFKINLGGAPLVIRLTQTFSSLPFHIFFSPSIFLLLFVHAKLLPSTILPWDRWPQTVGSWWGQRRWGRPVWHNLLDRWSWAPADWLPPVNVKS